MTWKHKQSRGFALISVLVALAILLALLVPFLSSILNEGRVSSGVVATEKTEVEIRGLVAHLLHQAGRGHPSQEIAGEGGSPDWDTLSEYPQRMTYPEAFESKPKRVLRSGGLQDLQRKIHLPTASPLVLGNLLGLATTLAGDFEKDVDEISVINGMNFPEDGGALFVFGERINYQRREGNTFLGISRTTSYPRNLPDETLVLDYRVVLAVTYQFQRAGRKRYTPYSNVREVQGIGEASGSPGRFNKAEMDTLLAHCTTYGQNDYSDNWGRKIRIFNDRDTIQAGPVWFLRTKSALGFGGGTIVRISSLNDPDQVEYNFVWGTSRPTSAAGRVRLQGRWRLNLAFNPTFKQNHIEAVVEPLIPVAVNVNTAGREVLVALFEKLRKGRVPSREQNGGHVYGKPITAGLADEMVARLLSLRAGTDQEDDEGRPFKGFEDLSKRFLHHFADKFKENGDEKLKTTLVVLIENLLYGRGPLAEMATMPICFASSSLVKFRAAALRMRPSGLEVARSEVEGVASVMPEHGLDFLSYRQRDWLENIRLNRRSPRYITFPKSMGAIDPGVLGNDPGVIYPGLMFAELYPNAGLGNLRFPSQDSGSIRLGTVISRPVVRGGVRFLQWSHESFRFAESPDGRDIATEGVFDMINTGPRSRGGGRKRPRHPDASFPFTSDNEGMPGRHAVTFWFLLESLGDQCVYDFASEHLERNRINLRFEGEDLVFEVLDEAGLDPNPSDTQTQPDRTAAVWRVPTQQMNLQPNVWYHVNLSADGNRPDQLALFIDGVPREEPELQTRLTTELDEYARPTGDQPISQTDADKYPQIGVESTEGFPPQGVLRIGRELFEYTSKDDSGFSCRPVDSMGGRKARMSWAEYRESLDQHLDDSGRPTINSEDLQGSETEDKAPAIPSGATVELYGYAAALYRDKPVAVGSTKLRDQVGAWSIARVLVDNPTEIRLPGSLLPFSPGGGLAPTDSPDLYLVNPVGDEEGKGPPDKSDGDEPILAGFPDGGGYALLVQQLRTWGGLDPNQIGQQPEDIRTGGIELIQYTKRDGNKLSGITRNAKLDGAETLLSESDQLYGSSGEGRYFVSEWGRFIRANVGGEIVPFAELQQMVLYVVPISLPVNDAGSLHDPAETQTVEWVQIYPGKGSEQDTEWVRYNLITKEGELVRAHHNAWRSLYNTICHQIGDRTLLTTGGIGRGTEPTVTPLAFKPPQDDGQKRIGYIDQLEQEHGIVYYARRSLSFRGDPSTGTTSHAFGSGAEVMAGHRLELDWGKLGALSARCGRNDRVALVGGTKASGDSRPPLEWHTLNWFWQRHGGDNYSREPSNNGVEPERWGPWSFQMVAFKAGVQNVFVGPQERTDFLDTRRVDRVVKFPSGELPAAYVEAAHFGGANPSVGDYSPAKGKIDELSAVNKYTESTILNIEITAEATEIPIRLHTRLYSYGTIGVRNQMTQSYPQEGGLLRIDNELIAYKSHADGIFQVAENGRGLLGTESREHGDCARVHFVPQIPCAILAGSAGASTNEFMTQDNGSFPHHGGTFLMGRELVHYTWTSRDNKLLEMPRWFDPDDDQTDGMGLFRGRYGTAPQVGASGSPILWFPTRFWDRYHKRSVDPELAYYQATRRETPVFFTGVRWKEENPESTFLKLHAIVNIDKAGSFAADPDKVRGMFEFYKGTVDDKSNPLNWQGSLIEVRFATEYKPGAFDPETYLSNGWKQAITVKDLIINYQGRSQILEETPTSR